MPVSLKLLAELSQVQTPQKTITIGKRIQMSCYLILVRYILFFYLFIFHFPSFLSSFGDKSWCLIFHCLSRSSNSPESGIGNSHLSLGALGEHFQDIDGDDEFYDPEPLPVLGKCKAIYPFEGNINIRSVVTVLSSGLT